MRALWRIPFFLCVGVCLLCFAASWLVGFVTYLACACATFCEDRANGVTR